MGVHKRKENERKFKNWNINIMMITRKIVADKLIAYLKHKITLAQLVDWSEDAMMDAEFEQSYCDQIIEVISRIGLADVKAFGLLWEDCEMFLTKLGYKVKIDIAQFA